MGMGRSDRLDRRRADPMAAFRRSARTELPHRGRSDVRHGLRCDRRLIRRVGVRVSRSRLASCEVAVSYSSPRLTIAIGSASMDNFCQSAVARSLPVVGDVALVIRAAGQNSVQASNLVVNIVNLTGSRLSFQNVDLGIDASQLDRGPSVVAGTPGSFASRPTKSSSTTYKAPHGAPRRQR